MLLNVGSCRIKDGYTCHNLLFMYSITHKWKSLTQSTILAASITSRTTLSPTFYYHSFVLITSKKRGRLNYSYLVSNWYFPFQVLILIIIIRIYKDEYILFMLSLQKKWDYFNVCKTVGIAQKTPKYAQNVYRDIFFSAFQIGWK